MSNDSAELLRHQQIEAAKDAIMRSPAFADMMSSPDKCALDMATAAVDAALAVRTSAVTDEMVENGARGMYGKTWDGPKEKMPGEEMKNVWRKLSRACLEGAHNVKS